MFNFKVAAILMVVFIAFTSGAYELGKKAEFKKCLSKVKSAVEVERLLIEGQIEKTNNKINNQINEIQRQNEIIDNSIYDYDTDQRLQLLDNIREIESARGYQQSL